MNKIQYNLLALTLFCVPIIATLKGKGTPILALVLFLVFGLKYINQAPILFKKVKNFDYKSISFWSVIFVIWVFISCLWAPDIGKPFSHSLRYFGFILCGHITFIAFQNFKKEDVQKYTKLYFASFIVFLAYMAFEVFGPHWVSVLYTKTDIFNKRLYINAVVILIFLLWPTILFLQTKYPKKFRAIYFIGLFFPLLFLLTKTEPNAALLAFFLSSVAYGLAHLSKNWIRIAKYTVLVLSVVLPILVSQSHLLGKYHDKIIYLATSYQHRLYIWNGMVEKNDTQQKKLIGNGFDYSTTVKGGQEICFRQLKPKFISFPSIEFELTPPCKEPIAIFTSHPHNGIIQIYVELGIIGLFIFLMLLWKVFEFIENQKDKILRSVYFAVLISYLTIFFISFGLWQTWMAGLMILTINSLLVISKYYRQNHGTKS